MSKKTKNIEVAVATEPTNDAAIIAQENAIEALVPALEEAASEGQIFELGEKIIELATEAKTKRVRNYQQTAISLEDHVRLNAIKARWKESLNLTVSNADIITAAIDLLSHEEHLEAFMKQLVTAADDKQRNKDLKKLADLQAKLGVATEA